MIFELFSAVSRVRYGTDILRQVDLHRGTAYVIIIIIIILFVQNKMHIKHVNKISEQDNKALRSALTAALSTIIQVQ